MRVQYTLVVTAEAGDQGEAVRRLKGLLKVALRRSGMRCVNVSETALEPSAGGRERVRREESKREVGRRKGCEVGLFG
jgi:hypothetical protein